MAGEVEVSVRSDDLTQAVRSLRGLENGKALRGQLRKDLRRSLSPAVPAIRSKVKSLPSKGETRRRGRPGLRRSTARATRLQMSLSTRKAQVTVRVDPKKMPPGQHNLPAYLNGNAPFDRWRVQNFGRDQWHTQGSHPYFDDIIRRYQPAAVRAVEEALDHIKGEIEG
jgi:hypothetical protein